MDRLAGNERTRFAGVAVHCRGVLCRCFVDPHAPAECGALPPSQWLHHDIVSRVRFVYKDPDRLDEKRRETGSRQPRVYSKNNKTEDVWADVETRLLQLPERVAAAPGELPPDLKGILHGGAATKLLDFSTPPIMTTTFGE